MFEYPEVGYRRRGETSRLGVARMSGGTVARYQHDRVGWGHSELLPLLIDSVEDYAIYALDADGNVATWNAGAEYVKGYTADEILGRNVSVFYRQEDIDAGLPEQDLA